jgi:hypothetical protein
VRSNANRVGLLAVLARWRLAERDGDVLEADVDAGMFS